MEIKRVFVALAAAIALSGCVKTMADMSGVPNSKYQPIIADESDKKEWIALITANTGKVVSDETGEYYFGNKEISGRKYVQSLTLRKPYIDLARSMLAQGVGVLEPVYRPRLTAGGVFRNEIDWAETQELHKALSGSFKLAPLATSQKYATLLDQWRKTLEQKYADAVRRHLTPTYANPILAAADNMSNENGLMATTLRGDFAFYGKFYYENVLERLKTEKVDFVLSTSVMANEMNQSLKMIGAFENDPLVRAGAENTVKTIPSYREYREAERLNMALKSNRWAMGDRIDWNFLSEAVYRNLKVTGFTNAPALVALSLFTPDNVQTIEQMSYNPVSAKGIGLQMIGATNVAYKEMAADMQEENRKILAEIDREYMVGKANRRQMINALLNHMAEGKRAMGIVSGLKSNTLR
ncbi:hypothetical protein [Azospirillum agricola]|uniref:hypothetical protein n=1 Tax=Azospirillum agricola TaxID=1720247 RepID=UPI000A0F0B13|nr:hypothetical protein [Azospirillum agricola]SMH59901.1 hypothetical protein SAMN02982994_5234 [Azospirillum lipoferum]